MQQKTLWAEVLKETKRWKSRWTVRDLLADRRFFFCLFITRMRPI